MKMVETPSNNGKINLYPHLDNDIQYRPNEINRIKDSFYCWNLQKRNNK